MRQKARGSLYRESHTIITRNRWGENWVFVNRWTWTWHRSLCYCIALIGVFDQNYSRVKDFFFSFLSSPTVGHDFWLDRVYFKCWRSTNSNKISSQQKKTNKKHFLNFELCKNLKRLLFHWTQNCLKWSLMFFVGCIQHQKLSIATDKVESRDLHFFIRFVSFCCRQRQLTQFIFIFASFYI